jgi:hypothetical protein
MRPPRRGAREWRHALVIVGLLAVFIPLYVGTLTHYQKAIVAAAGGLLKAFGTGKSTWTDTAGQWGVEEHRGGAGEEQRISLGGSRYSLGAFLAVAVLPAMLLGSPGTAGRRATAALAGVTILAACHMGMVAAYALAATGCRGVGGLICTNLKGALIYANYAAALAIWWPLAGRRWVECARGSPDD